MAKRWFDWFSGSGKMPKERMRRKDFKLTIFAHRRDSLEGSPAFFVSGLS